MKYVLEEASIAIHGLVRVILMKAEKAKRGAIEKAAGFITDNFKSW